MFDLSLIEWVVISMGGIILLLGGMRIGANNPVKVKLVAEKIEDIAKESVERGVAKSVEELKELRAKKGR